MFSKRSGIILNKKYVSVLIPRPDITLLYYSVTDNLNLEKGDVVEIELKKTKIWGIINSFVGSIPDGIKESSLKPILGKIISSPLFKDKGQTQFLEWLSDYYIYSFPKLIKHIFTPLINSDNTLIGCSDKESHFPAFCNCSASNNHIKLNSTQKAVVESVLCRWKNEDIRPTLIYGLTGSGKSEIFSALCKEILKSGKQILYLVPEIGLTTGALNHLIERMGIPGVVIHSFMSKKKRFSSMYCAMNKKAHLIVGTRSSIIYPFFDLGLIVVDEEHDTSYKNLEPPYYSARDAAVMKGSMLKIPVLLGSATPSSDSWLNAVNGKYNLEILDKRANSKPLPEIKSFVFKGEMYLPSELINIVSNSIKEKEQSLFFLNRRGFATFAVCPDCRATSMCPSCLTAMVYHKKKNRLLCHHCNFSTQNLSCLKCGCKKLEFEGMGVEKLAEALSNYFPGADIVSFDKDNLSTISMLDKAVKNITENSHDLIVGTVMISKGHNFPKLKNVIIKYADYLLSFKDIRAAEKCFQIITQVAGRAGRFEVEGSVWAEAIYPDHYIWKYLENNDYQGFIKEELLWRERLSLPPYTKITAIKISGKEENKVISATDLIFSYLSKTVKSSEFHDFVVFPPVEPPLSKINSKFRKNIVIISPKTSQGSKSLNKLLRATPELSGVITTFDIDSVNES